MANGKEVQLLGFYRFAFLDYLEHLALECIEEFKELAPAFRDAFGNEQTPVGGPGRLFVIEPTKGDPIDIVLALTEKGDHANLTKADLTESDLDTLTRFSDFRIKFTSLIEKYCLTPLWLRDELLKYVHRIANYPDNHHYLAFASSYGDVLSAPRFIINVPGWEVAYEKPVDFKKRAKEQFFESLNHYLARVGVDPRYEGFISKPGRPEDYGRVKWLVRWTVQGWDYKKILEEFVDEDLINFKDLTEGSIRKAFKKFEKFGLPIREN